MSRQYNKSQDSVPRGPGAGRPEDQDSSPGRVQDEDRIRCRAYEISQARHGAPGDPVADWTQAERELRAGSDARRAMR